MREDEPVFVLLLLGQKGGVEVLLRQTVEVQFVGYFLQSVAGGALLRLVPGRLRRGGVRTRGVALRAHHRDVRARVGVERALAPTRDRAPFDLFRRQTEILQAVVVAAPRRVGVRRAVGPVVLAHDPFPVRARRLLHLGASSRGVSARASLSGSRSLRRGARGVLRGGGRRLVVLGLAPLLPRGVRVGSADHLHGGGRRARRCGGRPRTPLVPPRELFGGEREAKPVERLDLDRVGAGAGFVGGGVGIGRHARHERQRVLHVARGEPSREQAVVRATKLGFRELRERRGDHRIQRHAHERSAHAFLRARAHLNLHRVRRVIAALAVRAAAGGSSRAAPTGHGTRALRHAPNLGEIRRRARLWRGTGTARGSGK